MKKAFTKLLSPMLESVDGNTINIARPGPGPLILTTPTLTIRAADIAMPVIGKILLNLLAPK